ncbi:MAG: hypothetical protein AAGB46_06880 [Verrucomicrobiota bacterium]
MKNTKYIVATIAAIISISAAQAGQASSKLLSGPKIPQNITQNEERASQSFKKGYLHGQASATVGQPRKSRVSKPATEVTAADPMKKAMHRSGQASQGRLIRG